MSPVIKNKRKTPAPSKNKRNQLLPLNHELREFNRVLRGNGKTYYYDVKRTTRPRSNAEWFNTIKDDMVRGMLFDNCSPQRQYMVSRNMPSALLSFDWRLTPQGEAFWSAIHNHFSRNCDGLKTFNDFKHLLPPVEKKVSEHKPEPDTSFVIPAYMIRNTRETYRLTPRIMDIILNLRAGDWSGLEKNTIPQTRYKKRAILLSLNIDVIRERIYPDGKLNLQLSSADHTVLQRFETVYLDIVALKKLAATFNMYK